MLVVSTARALVYNYLPAPYLPAGSLPDRGVRCPTEPSKRQMEMEMGGFLAHFHFHLPFPFAQNLTYMPQTLVMRSGKLRKWREELMRAQLANRG